MRASLPRFEFDITKWAHPGCNTLTIELENDYVMLGNRTERSEAVLCGDKIYAATGPGYDDPQLGWHHCPPGMGLLDTVLIETRPEIHFQTVFARCLEEEVEFWIEVGSCVYEYRDISFLLSVYGQNFEETVLEEFPCRAFYRKAAGCRRHLLRSACQTGRYAERTVAASVRKGTKPLQGPHPCHIPSPMGTPTRRGCIKSSSSCWTRQAALLIHTAASLGSARFASRQRRNRAVCFS